MTDPQIPPVPPAPQPPLVPPAYGEQPPAAAPPAPTGYPQPAPGYAAPADYPPSAPGYAPPAAFAPPPGGYAPPAGGYAPPDGAYAAGPTGYQGYLGEYAPEAPKPKRKSTLGTVALLLAGIALIVPTIAAAIFGYQIGDVLRGLGYTGIQQLETGDIDVLLEVLIPVRMQVLWIEIAFWIGTVLGIWAIIQGIVAIARNAGRGAGIAGLIIAVLAPIVFGTVTVMMVALGIATAMAGL